METPDGKLQTITVPAGNFAVSKRPSPPKPTSGGRGRKRSATVLGGNTPLQQLTHDRSLYSIISSSVSVDFLGMVL